jgi:branched-chain amino acid transport system substrate-binding protein
MTRRVPRLSLMALTLAFAIGLSVVTASRAGSSSKEASSPGVTSKSILFGSTVPVTGPASSVGIPVSSGTKAWFDYVNSHGGINGRKIHLTVLDDALSPQRAVANVQTLIDKPVFAVIGGTGSASSVAVFPILQQAHVPYLFPNGGGSQLVVPTQSWVFALLPLYKQQDLSLIKYEFHKYGPGSLAVLATTLPELDTDLAAVENQVKASGGKFLGSLTATTFAGDYTSYALKLKQMNPDYLLIEAGAVDAANAINAMDAQGWLPKHIIGISTLSTPPFLAVNAHGAARVTTLSPTVLGDSPRARQCLAAFKREKLAADALSLYGCAGAQIATVALKKAGRKLTRASFLRALNGLDGPVVATVGKLSLAKNNHTALGRMFLVTVQNGKFKTGGAIPTK